MLGLKRSATSIKRQRTLERRYEKLIQSIKDKKFVFSGFRDPQLEAELKRKGATVSSSVTKDTTLVIVLDTNIETTKTSKAKELGIPIILRDYFFSKYGLYGYKFDRILPPSKVGNAKVYYIHDNGGRPFRVAVTSDEVNVKKLPPDPYDHGGYDIEVLSLKKPLKVWIGDEAYGVKAKHAIGNSILVKMAPQVYTYIGDSIYVFTTLNGEEIDEFHGDVGNSDVVYSYAYSQSYTYFFIEETMLENRILDEYDPNGEKDPYQVLYSHDDRKIEKEIQKKVKKLPNFKEIQKRIF